MNETLGKGIDTFSNAVVGSGDGTTNTLLFVCIVAYIALIALYLFFKKKQVAVRADSKLRIRSQLHLNRKQRILEVDTSSGSVLIVLSDTGVAAIPLHQDSKNLDARTFNEVVRQTKELAA